MKRGTFTILVIVFALSIVLVHLLWPQRSIKMSIRIAPPREQLELSLRSSNVAPSIKPGRGKKELCRALLSSSKGSIPVRQDFVDECNRLVCSNYTNSTLPQFLEKIYEYIQWVQGIDRGLQSGKVEKILNSEIKWLHVNRGRDMGPGFGDIVANVRMAFVLSILSGRFFLADFGPQCNGTMYVWQPNVIPWKVTNELDRQLQIRKGKHKILDCKSVFRESRVVLLSINPAIDHSIPCLTTIEEFSKLPQDDRVHVFLAALLTHLLVDFVQSETLVKRVESFKVKYQLPNKYASMHVRTGMFSNGLKEVVSRFTPTQKSWDQQISCALEFMRRRAITLPLVLCTDSNELKAFARKYYGNSKVVSTNINSTHTQDITLKKHWDQCEESFADAQVDAWLMAHSELIILAVSTFSSLSSNIGLIPYQKQTCCWKKDCSPYRAAIMRH